MMEDAHAFWNSSSTIDSILLILTTDKDRKFVKFIGKYDPKDV